MAFLEDPRLRQRWNQIAHDAEAVTENAAAGIWSFQHNYINPCFGSIADSIEQCTTVCLGDPDERLRRRRERERAHGVAEYSFDFYDDWYEEENGAGGGGGGLLGSWGGEDWDRLLAGTGSARKHAGGETAEQPRRKRGMSYGTRGPRRKSSEPDPTIIPSTQPIGFLSKLPWKMGGTLRYKPSAADLQEHPGKHDQGHGLAETEPLLGPDTDSNDPPLRVMRQRSGTTGSGDTSDSYRSRGDLFPSDGEGDEDAVPLDDEVTYDMIRKDDRSSGKTSRTRSSKGKRPANGLATRTVSRTTLGSSMSGESPELDRTMRSLPATPDAERVLSLEDLEREEELLRQEEEEEVARRKEAATQLAARMGLGNDAGTHPRSGTNASSSEGGFDPGPESEPIAHEQDTNGQGSGDRGHRKPEDDPPTPAGDGVGRRQGGETKGTRELDFHAARLPNFG
ncbi:hypothetical protein JDV02_004762 [Purpureocillium takamizusanense]|uniref:Uncharacterized protein n=1 Tax=Purpureocillium takamizusanense TaxID=2060973 RepID=A0A9Q8QF67_9HYPO|nr:uncharacterized protein JDV02_004762 [Purpureocillium takamizusanense]UNI18495.1 hypothetical protein JDV02_004762 [Purpureocillium takamizusanense]